MGLTVRRPLLGEPSTIAGRARTPKESAALVYFNQAFAKAMASAGIAVGIKTRNGSEVKAVPVSAVRAEFYKIYPTGETEADKRAATLRQAFHRALKKLHGNYAIEEQDGTEWVWPTKGFVFTGHL